MATERLYQRAPYLAEFDATVTEVLQWEGKPAVVLDATCFYPTSGGQPHDLGTLSGVPVVDVIESGERIVHVLTAPLGPGPVHGVLDWQRRFDHMQQHSGQHILSQAFERVLKADTVSFHLGSASSTIDLALGTIGWEAVQSVEELANRIIVENQPVTVGEFTESESARLALRRPPAVHRAIRVVQVGDFDTCACGGTHVRATGEVGSIHVRRWERRRGQTRLEFLCGWRALRDHRTLSLAGQAVAARLSVPIAETPQAVGRLIEYGQAREQQLADLRRRLLECELPGLFAQAEPLGDYRVLCRVLDGYDAASMRYAAQGLVQEPGLVALLGVTEPAPQVCFARSGNVSAHMGQLMRTVLTPFGGRGGGEPHLAQGGGFAAEQLAAVLQSARDGLSSP